MSRRRTARIRALTRPVRPLYLVRPFKRRIASRKSLPDLAAVRNSARLAAWTTEAGPLSGVGQALTVPLREKTREPTRPVSWMMPVDCAIGPGR